MVGYIRSFLDGEGYDVVNFNRRDGDDFLCGGYGDGDLYLLPIFIYHADKLIKRF